jgi:hypothetical protein
MAARHRNNKKLATFFLVFASVVSLFALFFSLPQNKSRAGGYVTNPNAILEQGQPSFTTGLDNASLGGTDNLGYPDGLVIVGTKLIILDTQTSRALIYNSIPSSNGNPTPNVVVGQTNLTNVGEDDQASGVASNANSIGLDIPNGITSNGTDLIIADTNNNRVMIWNTIPTSSGTAANVVIGQTALTNNQVNQGGSVGANTLSAPTGVYFDGTNLYVSDTGNNRVLIFNSIPSSNNASANVVVGQSAVGNSGSACTATGMHSPYSVNVIGGNLYVADQINNRVLEYSGIPSANGASANFVLGQGSATSCNQNRGGSIGAGTMVTPDAVASDGTNLFVADTGNNRVLLFEPIPTATGTSASFAIGQQNLTSGFANQCHIGSFNYPLSYENDSEPDYCLVDSNLVSAPQGLLFFGSTLYIADTANSRILGYTSVPTANNVSANFEIGHVNFFGRFGISPNDNYGLSSESSQDPLPNSMSDPSGEVIVGSKLVVSDTTNNRILIWNTIPTSSDTAPNVEIGQPDFYHDQPNQGTSTANSITANDLELPEGLTTDGTKLVVADAGNNRILVYNTVPTSNDAAANVVIGQADMAHNGNPGAENGSSFQWPEGVNYDATSGDLFICDTAQDRVVVFTSGIPTSNGASGNFVVGSTNLTTFPTITPVSASNLDHPTDARVLNGDLTIADAKNNRVLIYSGVPSANNPSATIAVGQSNLTNHGSSGGTQGLNYPTDMGYDGTTFFVQDSGNTRLDTFSSFPSASAPTMTAVLGQSTLFAVNCNGTNQALSAFALASTLCTNRYIASVTYLQGGASQILTTATGVYVTDNNNGRLMFFPQSPTVSALAQFKADCSTTVASGGQTGSTSVCLGATMSDVTTSDTLTLQVEVELNTTPFQNTVSNTGTGVAFSGSPVTSTIVVTGLTNLSSYHWQARVEDSEGNFSPWLPLGGNPDFIAGGGTTPPNAPSALAQFRNDGVTAIPNNTWTPDGITNNVVFSFSMTSPNGSDTLTPEIELVTNASSFTGTPNHTGSAVTYSGSPITGTVTVTGLTNCTGYKWEAYVGNSGGLSTGTIFNATTPNFSVQNTTPVAGTVYDGSTNGVEVSQVSNITTSNANWTGFSDACSGLTATPYQVAIGTTSGGTNVLGYTQTGVSGTTFGNTTLALQTGKTYYVSVKATNNVGLTVIATSSGQSLLPSLSFTVNASSVTLPDWNASDSYDATSTNTLSVLTDGYNGYNVYAYETGIMTNGSATVPNFSGGSYATPSIWGLGQTGFGYTSSAASINGTNLYGGGTKYAPFNQTAPGDIVAQNANNITGSSYTGNPDSYTITYQAVVPANQATGTYSTGIVYTIVPSF